MAGSWISDRFQRFEKAIRRLVAQHRELKDEPLHLAVCYGSVRNQRDIFLFEVVGNTAESVSMEGDLFETTFSSTLEFPMGAKDRLHLILTNPRELETAVREQWPLAAEVASAVRSLGDHEILFADKVGKRLLSLIRADHSPRRSVRG
jgi:hypothetical protein